MVYINIIQQNIIKKTRNKWRIDAFDYKKRQNEQLFCHCDVRQCPLFLSQFPRNRIMSTSPERN